MEKLPGDQKITVEEVSTREGGLGMDDMCRFLDTKESLEE